MTSQEQHLQLRLLVDVQQASSPTRRDLEADTLAALGTGWTVTRLFPHAPEPSLARHWVVTGEVPVSPAYPPAPLAYDLAAALAQHIGQPVEPDLPSSAFGPEPGAGFTAEFAAEPDRAGHLDGSAAKDWALKKIKAMQAWARAVPSGGSSRGRGVLIGHIDTGYSDHPDLERSALDLTRDLDVVDGDDDARDPLTRRWWWPLDSPGHGTLTGSVIASRVGRDIVGAAPEVTLLPVRAVRSVVQVFDADVARAVDHARRSGCHVITMSLGGRGFIGLQDVIRRAVADGIIVMAAAGNEVGFVVAPAVYPECLAVAASNADDKPWAGSSRGDAVDVSAPGESVWAARVDAPGQFRPDRSSGTSFAVAHLAAVAALWVAFHGADVIRRRYGRERVQDAFLSLVRSTCHVPAHWDDSQYGAGIVDADALLAAGLPRTAPDDLAAAPQFDAFRQFGVDRTTLPGELAQHSSELVYLVGENPELASALLGPATTPGTALAALGAALGTAPRRAAGGGAAAAWPGMSQQLSAALAHVSSTSASPEAPKGSI